MTAETAVSDYVTIPEIAAETGATYHTVHSWLHYHRHMTAERVLGRIVVHRSDYEKFKEEHPELVQRAE